MLFRSISPGADADLRATLARNIYGNISRSSRRRSRRALPRTSPGISRREPTPSLRRGERVDQEHHLWREQAATEALRQNPVRMRLSSKTPRTGVPSPRSGNQIRQWDDNAIVFVDRKIFADLAARTLIFRYGDV